MSSLLRSLTRSFLLSLLSLSLVSLVFAGLWLWFLPSSSLFTSLYKTASPLNSLYAVTALSTSNVWAVGETSLEDGMEPLIERWNGVAWSVIASPTLPPGPFRSSHQLKAISTQSGNDIWAAGCSNCNNASTAPLIEHWDGGSWKIVPSAKQNIEGGLNGITVLSPTNAWAVGRISNAGQNRPLIEHWNGAIWQVLSHPGLSFSGYLNGVAALSPRNVWVVGEFFEHEEMGPLIEHWDGSRWKIVVGPGAIREFSSCRGPLYAITALSAQDIWTVGTCLLQWNGATWQLRGGPHMPAERSAPTWYASTGASPATLWIAGYSAESKLAIVGQWNGQTWKTTSIGTSGENLGRSRLFSIAMSSAEDVWAVGDARSASKTLLLRWQGENWQRLASPDPGLSQRVPIVH